DHSTMLHVRVASPAAETAELVGLLADSPGVVNLVVLPGAARNPAGDAVQFDLSVATANPVLRRLRDLRSTAAGPITIEAIDGAMVVGPEYNAIIAVAQGIERRNRPAVWRGVRALIVGFLLAVAVSLLFALFIRGIGQVPELYQKGVRPVSDFINSPDLFSV